MCTEQCLTKAKQFCIAPEFLGPRKMAKTKNKIKSQAKAKQKQKQSLRAFRLLLSLILGHWLALLGGCHLSSWLWVLSLIFVDFIRVGSVWVYLFWTFSFALMPHVAVSL